MGGRGDREQRLGWSLVMGRVREGGRVRGKVGLIEGEGKGRARRRGAGNQTDVASSKINDLPLCSPMFTNLLRRVVQILIFFPPYLNSSFPTTRIVIFPP